MKTRVVARRYAQAFFAVINGENLDEAHVEFSAFATQALGSGEVAQMLRHPAVRYESKASLVKALLPPSKVKHIDDFILLLLKRHRFSLFSLIVEEVEALYRQARNIVSVTVKSAVSLNAGEREQIRLTLNKRVNGTVELTEVVDPNVRGGMIVSFGDKIMDASVTTRLKHLKERMSSLSSELLDSLEETPSQLS